MLTSTMVHRHLKGSYRRFYRTFIPDLPKKSSGSNWINTRCPLHPDSNPSFGINTRTGIWNCFSSCGSGNTVDFFMKLHNCSEQTAVKEIAKTFRITLAGIKPTVFIYKTPEGKAILRKVRRIGDDGSKRIYWQHKDKGKWLPGTGSITWAPYRWDKITKYQGPIWVVEGELASNRQSKNSTLKDQPQSTMETGETIPN